MISNSSDESERYDSTRLSSVDPLVAELTERDDLQCIGIVGSEAGVGASTLSWNLALSAAMQTDHRVLLIDCDRNERSLSNRRALWRPGLIDVLRNQAELCDAVTDFSNVSFLPYGDSRVRIPAKAFAKLIEAARLRFDTIVLDLPEAAFHLSSCADAILLVIEAHVTTRSVARRTKRRLVGAGANVIGAILNKRD